MSEDWKRKTFLLLPLLSLVSGAEIQTRPAGSTLYLSGTEACKDAANIDLKKGPDFIAWYDSNLTPRLNMSLEFDEQNCTFIMSNLKLEDSAMYTIIERYIDKELQKTFNVTVIADHVTSVPPSQTPMAPDSNLTACHMGFLAVCFSLAPPINVIIVCFYLLPCWSGCITQKYQNMAPLLSGIVSLACQGISIGSWVFCGIWNGPVLFGLAVSTMAILGTGYILSPCKCVKADCFEKFIPKLIFYMMQFGFTAFVMIPFCSTYGAEIIQPIWAPITFILVYLGVFTLPCIVFKIYRTYFRPKITEEGGATEMEKMNPSENGSSVKQTDKSAPLPI